MKFSLFILSVERYGMIILFPLFAGPPSMRILNVSIFIKQASPCATLSWWIWIICAFVSEMKRRSARVCF